MTSPPDLVIGDDGRSRCGWSGTDAEYQSYHDDEWGHALHGDRELFEKLSLEAFQSGLSWLTILRRRVGFRVAFTNFDIVQVATLDETAVESLVADERIIRNRAKIRATIENARITRDIVAANPGSFDQLMWSFAPPARRDRLRRSRDVPVTTAESVALSSELRKRGFRFVGPTTMYALMQSSGMVDDHLEGCWRADRQHENEGD